MRPRLRTTVARRRSRLRSSVTAGGREREGAQIRALVREVAGDQACVVPIGLGALAHGVAVPGQLEAVDQKHLMSGLDEQFNERAVIAAGRFTGDALGTPRQRAQPAADGRCGVVDARHLRAGVLGDVQPMLGDIDAKAHCLVLTCHDGALPTKVQKACRDSPQHWLAGYGRYRVVTRSDGFLIGAWGEGGTSLPLSVRACRQIRARSLRPTSYSYACQGRTYKRACSRWKAPHPETKPGADGQPRQHRAG